MSCGIYVPVYVCVCVCMCVYVCVCVCMCVYVCVCERGTMEEQLMWWGQVSELLYICTCVCVCMCVYVCMECMSSYERAVDIEGAGE